MQCLGDYNFKCILKKKKDVSNLIYFKILEKSKLNLNQEEEGNYKNYSRN